VIILLIWRLHVWYYYLVLILVDCLWHKTYEQFTSSSPQSWIWIVSASYYADNSLWDGIGCASASSCCQFNTPPWFCASLPQATSESLEMRVCHGQHPNDEDVIVSLVDIYVMWTNSCMNWLCLKYSTFIPPSTHPRPLIH